MRLREILTDPREAQCVRPEKTNGFEFRTQGSKPELNGAQGKFFITPYAVRRYIERIRPRISYEDALSELILLTSAGSSKGPYKGQTLQRQYPRAKLEMWRGPKIKSPKGQDPRSRLRFVVGHGEGELPQVVTILPIPGRTLNECLGAINAHCE